MLNFLLKIFLASALISLAIKYGGPLLHLPPTSLVAGLIIFSVPLGMTAFLSWRWLNLE